ncbi:MAG: hypothetical protein JNL30_05760 [Rubrivivax sp.]|nr:hypothetical protein [Rubrivivax sp.]
MILRRLPRHLAERGRTLPWAPWVRALPLAVAAAVAVPSVRAQGAADPGAAAAALAMKSEAARAHERCEASVAETLRKLRGRQADDVQFAPGQRVVVPADDADIGVKGAGRYRSVGVAGRAAGAGHSFTFSCTFNTRTGLASGVVLRETGGAASPDAWQPDLSRVSPEACESAVAQHLKSRHPRVASIALEPDTRRLEPGADERTVLLLGQGAVQRAAGMNAVPFTYRCELDARSGRVMVVKTSV